MIASLSTEVVEQSSCETPVNKNASDMSEALCLWQTSIATDSHFFKNKLKENFA